MASFPGVTDPVAAMRNLRQFENVELGWKATPYNPRFSDSLVFWRSYHATDASQPRFPALPGNNGRYVQGLCDRGRSPPARSETESPSGVDEDPMDHQEPAPEGTSKMMILATAAEQARLNQAVPSPADHQKRASDDKRNLIVLKRASEDVESNSVVKSPVDQQEPASVDAKHPGDVKWEEIKAKISTANEKNQHLDASIENLERRKIVAQQKAKKAKDCGPLTPAVAVPNQTAPPPGLHTNNLPVNFDWRFDYMPGNLHHLGLEAGVWGPDIKTVNRPRQMQRTGKPNTSVGPNPRIFDWQWGLHTILNRLPRGEATLDVIFKYCQEWCPLIPDKGRRSASHSLSVKPEFFNHEVDDVRKPGGKVKLWRITNVGEVQVKNPGPKRKTDEDEDESDEPPRNKKRRVLAASFKAKFSPSSTSATSSTTDQASSSDNPSPASTHTPLSTPSSGFTPINRQSSASSERTLLPSSPTQRKTDEEDDISEQPNERRRMK